MRIVCIQPQSLFDADDDAPAQQTKPKPKSQNLFGDDDDVTPPTVAQPSPATPTTQQQPKPQLKPQSLFGDHDDDVTSSSAAGAAKNNTTPASTQPTTLSPSQPQGSKAESNPLFGDEDSSSENARKSQAAPQQPLPMCVQISFTHSALSNVFFCFFFRPFERVSCIFIVSLLGEQVYALCTSVE